MVLAEMNMSNEIQADNLNGQKMAENKKSWERPWSTDEVRKNSNNWTLAGDIGLLKHLQEFSHQLISRTHEMEKAIDGVVHESKETCAKVNNVINDFQMLSNLKFVENRVYDEDICDTTTKDAKEDGPVLTKEQKENEMLARVKQALQLGLNVLDDAFERVEIDESSDSEDEDLSQGRTELKPKDLYENRPLPFIIGTDEFQKDDFVGLKYIIEEPLLEDYSYTQDDNISDSTSESETESDKEFDNYEERIPDKKDISAKPEFNKIYETETKKTLSDSEESELFGNDDEEQENEDLLKLPTEEMPEEETKPQNDFLKELENKLKLPSEKPTKVDRKNTVTSNIEEVTKASKKDDLFENDDSFLNDSDESDSMFEKKDKTITKDTISDSLFGENKKIVQDAIVKELEKKNKIEKKVEKRDSLFDNDDDDDDDTLFGSLSEKLPTKSSISTIAKSKSIESFKRPPKQTVTPPAKSNTNSTKSFNAKEKSSDSLFGSDSDSELFSDEKKSKNKNNFDFSNDDDDGLFDTLGVSDRKKSETKALPEIKPKEKSNSLFDDSDDLSLFGSLSKSEPKTAKKSLIIEDKDSLLFDDNSDLFEPIPSIEDLLSTNIKPTVKESKAVQREIKEPEHKILKSLSSQGSEKGSKLQMENPMEPVLDISTPSKDDVLSVSFDTPVDSISTLNALNKDRVKIQVKRRRPTKKGRQALQTQEDDPKNNSNTTVPEIENEELFSKKEEKVSHKIIEKEKQNLMSQLMSEAAISKIGKKKSPENELFSPSEEPKRKSPENDLFSSSEDPNSVFSFTSPASSKPVSLFKDKDVSNIFDIPDDDDDLFSEKSSTFHTGDSKSTFNLDDDDDDIFGNDDSKDIVSHDPDDIFGEDSIEDIFATDDNKKYDMFPKSKFEDDDDDDDVDIFKNLSKPVKTTENKAKSSEEKKTESIFEDPLGGLSLNK